MAREAAVRLTLSNAQFLTEIKRTGDAVDAAGRKGKKAMDLFGGSADTAKRSFASLAASVKNTLGMATGLAGAFSVGNAVREASKLQRTYRQIAFGVRDANGRMLEAAEVQRIAERTAAQTGQSNADMADSFRDLLRATGDLGFSREVLESVGTAAMATGEELGTITSIADQMHTKFGVSAAGMKDALAQVIDLAQNAGGPSFTEFAEVMSNVGAEAVAAGVTGKRGLDFILGALVKTDDEFKSVQKQVAGLKAVFRGLGEKGELRKLANQIGLDPKKLINEKDALARLRMILGKGKEGVKALLDPMHEGEEKRTMEILFTDPFKAALAEAQGAGLKGKAAIDRALVTFDGQIAQFGKAQMDGAALQREADAQRRTPEAQLTEALNRLNTAFSQPAIIKALNDLSVQLPKLATFIGEVVGWAAQNPLAATTAGVAGKVAIDAGMSAATAGAGALLKQLFTRGAGAAAGAAGAAASGAGAAAGGAAAAGGTAAAGGALALLGPAALIAGGAALSYGLGSEQIGNAYQKEDNVMKELASATAAGFGGGNLEQLRAMLDRLEKAKSDARAADVGGGFMDAIARTVTGVDSQAQAAEAIKLAQEATAKLQKKIRELENRPAATPEAAPTPAKAAPVALDSGAPRAIAEATKTALGGMILNVRIANGPGGLGTSAPGPGGSRGPMGAAPARQGGGV